jgi:hypothetical protein
MTWKAAIKQEDYSFRQSLAIWRRDGDVDHVLILGPIQRLDPCVPISESQVLELPKEEMRAVLQALVDVAWDQGIRPGLDLKAAQAAQDRHLADMRAIVAAKLAVKLP